MKTNNPHDLAAAIRRALEAKGYDIVLREMSPRTDVGRRNLDERTLELANELISKGV